WRGVDAIWVSGDVPAPDGASTGLGEFGAPVTAPPYTANSQRHLATITEEPKGARELAAAVVLGRRVRPLDLIPDALRPRRLTRPQMLTIGSAAAAVLLGLAAML